MPFKKIGNNKYVSPSGRKWTEKQKNLYYATEGFTKKPKRNHKQKGRR